MPGSRLRHRTRASTTARRRFAEFFISDHLSLIIVWGSSSIVLDYPQKSKDIFGIPVYYSISKTLQAEEQNPLQAVEE
jgi:hypothetical protein